MVRSVGLCCDKLLLEELTNTPKASFQDKFQWLSAILATQHQAFGFNYILNSLLYIFLFLCIDIVSIRKKFLPIFSVWRRLCFCFFIISDSQTGRFRVKGTICRAHDLAVVCIYCFSICGNRHTPWKILINVCFQKDSLKSSFLQYTQGITP